MRRSGLVAGLAVCVGGVLFPAVGRSQSGSVTQSAVIPVSGQEQVSGQSLVGGVGPTLPAGATAVVEGSGVSGNGGDSDDGRVVVRKNPDGSKTARIAVTETGLLGSDGKVKKFDSGLVKQGGRWVPGSVVDVVSFGSATDDGSAVVSVGLSGRSVRFGRPSATAFSALKREVGDGKVKDPERPVGCNGSGVGSESKRVGCASVGKAVGNRVSFDGVFGSGGDLVYEVGAKEVKERIVLASVPEEGRPVEFRFPMVLEGVRAQLAGDGGVTFSAPSGEVVYGIPPGFAWDSRNRGVGGPEVAVGASVSRVEFGLEDGGATLVVRPDVVWLRDPLREFPVSIDPTIEVGRGLFNAVSNRLAPGTGGAPGTVANGSFEAYWSGGWQRFIGNGVTNVVMLNNPSIAKDGSVSLLTNTSSTDGGSVYQDIALNVPAGVPVTVTGWVRPYPGNAVTTGSFCGWVLWSTVTASCTNYSVPDGPWVRMETVVESTGVNSVVRVQLYPGVNAPTVMLDGVSVTPGNTGLRNGSFEHSMVAWGPFEPSTAATLVTNGALAHDGGKFLQATGTVAGASVFQDLVLASASGQPFAVSSWFRAGSATPVWGTMCAWQVGATVDPSCTGFSATNAGWVRASTIAQTGSSKTAMRVQVYFGSLNAPLLIDTVSALRTGDVSGVGAPAYPPSSFAPTYAGEAVFGSWFGSKQYSRLKFDLPPSLTGASVNSAVLRTFVRNCDHISAAAGNAQLSQYANPIHVRRMVADFDTSPDAVQDDRAVLPVGFTAYANADVTDFVRGWAADPGSNFGVRLDMGDIPGGNYGYCKVASRSDEFAGDLNKTTYLEVTYNEAPAATKRFHPINPVTVMNSTTGVGTASTGGAGYQAGRWITVMGGSTGVPTSGVSAVAVSVTATNRDVGSLGAVKVYPGGPSQPAAVETIWPVGASVGANQAIVPIGQGNQIVAEVFAGRGDVQLDITGWFDDGTPATAAGGLRFQPLVGERIVDTRYGFGGPLVGGVTRQFAVLGQGGIPPGGVGAVALQVHGIGSGGGPARVKVWAVGDVEPPDTAALVLGSGADQRSALMFVKTGANWQMNVKSSASLTLVVDAMGYFVTSATAGAGFQPVSSQRIYDSRLPANGGVKINDADIRVSDGPGVGAVLVNVIAVEPNGAALVDVFPSGEPTNNFDTMMVPGAGQYGTSSLALVRPSADGRIHVNVAPVSAHIVVDLVGYTGTADTVGTSAGNQLVNGSFEVGSGSWGTNTACGDAAGAVSFTTVTPSASGTDRADDGNSYARVVSSSATVAGSLCQNVNRSATPPKAGDRYTLNFRVRSDPGQPAGRGMLELWELGNAPTSVNTQQPFITSGTWTEKTLSMCASNSANFTLRTKIYPYGTVPLDIDNVRLTVTSDPACQLFNSVPTVADLNSLPPFVASANVPNGGFETAFSDWESCHPPEYQALQGGVANFSWYAGPTLGSRGGYLATNVGVVGGNRACRRLAGAPTNGSSPHVFTAWVRSEDGSDVPWSTLQLSGTVHTFSTIDPNDYYGSSDAQITSATVFTAKANWQKISVRWWPPSGTDGKQTFRDSFYASVVPGSPGKTILVDEVTEVGPLTANPCGGFWSRSACFGTPQPLDPPINTDLEPLKLLTDGQATFIHDPLRTRCLKLESDRTVKIVVYSAAACTTFLPFADLDTTGLPTFSGWTLWAGYDSCLTSTATGVRVEECDGTNAQRFFDILTSDSPLTFTVRNVASGFCLDGVTFGQATFNACSGGSTQTWADAAKNGSPVGPPVGTIPQSPEEGMHLQGTEADDRFDIEQENILLPAGSWGGDVFSKLGTVEEVMGFINPIHKLVQIDIARKLVAQGKEAWIECAGLGNTFPDICTPPKPSIGYRHAEVKPGNFGVMAPSTAAIAALQLALRDRRMNEKAGFPVGSYRATANDGWPVAGSITVGTSIIPVGFKIDYVLQSPGLYVYRTNFRDVVLTGALARALRDILRDDYGSRLTDLINEIRVRFPNPQSPAARWIKQHKGAIPRIVIGVVIAGVIVTAIVVAPVAIGPALIGGTGVGLGFGIG